ncbi:hypothetical protein D3C71_1672120 [compost metagenome]
MEARRRQPVGGNANYPETMSAQRYLLADQGRLAGQAPRKAGTEHDHVGVIGVIGVGPSAALQQLDTKQVEHP